MNLCVHIIVWYLYWIFVKTACIPHWCFKTDSELFCLPKCLNAVWICYKYSHTVSKNVYKLYKWTFEGLKQMWVLFRYRGLVWVTYGMLLLNLALKCFTAKNVQHGGIWCMNKRDWQRSIYFIVTISKWRQRGSGEFPEMFVWGPDEISDVRAELGMKEQKQSGK